MTTVILSPLAQTKMALHSARHGFSPIHGILIGHRSRSSLEVTDAIPVCHEVPTRPVVNTSLRLVDIHLKDGENKIIGWYTANSNGGDEPNIPALRVVNSMAEQCEEQLILVLVSAEPEGSLCTVFEGGKGKTFTQRVESSRIQSGDLNVRDAINRGIKDMSHFSSGFGEKNGLTIYDYVDHVTEYEKKGGLDEKNWIENRSVVDFVARAIR